MVCKILIQIATVNKKGRPNQDNLLADKYIPGISRLEFFSSSFITDNTEKRVFAVADGVGGESAGDLASETVVKSLFESLCELKNKESDKETLLNAVDRANEKVVNLSDGSDISASTLSGVICAKQTATVFNIGDSPIYYLHNTTLIRLDCAHTLSSEKGANSTGNKSSYDDNVITRYMGNRLKSGREQINLAELDLSVGDVFLICSDGVEKGLTENAVRKLLCKNKGNVAENIVKKAYEVCKKNGRADDTTAILIKILG